MKAQKVRDLETTELETQRKDIEEQLFRLRFQMSMGQMDGLKKAEKDGGVAKDALESYEKEVQKLTDGFVKKIDDLLATKEADIMKV